jgi:hypothetical protein
MLETRLWAFHHQYLTVHVVYLRHLDIVFPGSKYVVIAKSAGLVTSFQTFRSYPNNQDDTKTTQTQSSGPNRDPSNGTAKDSPIATCPTPETEPELALHVPLVPARL